MEATSQDYEHGRSNFDADLDKLPPSVGTKRLFSNRESKQLTGYEGVAELDAGEDGTQSGKRPRNSDWPLPCGSPPSARVAQRGRNVTISPPSIRRASSQLRTSRFMEGSMNDKVSQRPPAPYVGDEDARERYEKDEDGRRISFSFSRPRNVRQPIEEASVASKSEAPRNSIFRFGKSIAATFNPTNWKIFGKHPVAEDVQTPQQRLLRERQEKAARIYQELKESGQFRDTAIGSDFYEPVENTRLETGKHDSGVSFNVQTRSLRGSREYSRTREDKRQGRVFLEIPEYDTSVHGESPASNVAGSVSNSHPLSPKPGFLRKPSLASIRNSFSNDSTSNLSMNNGEQHQARRIPSRKDMQKQQKLVKRVSDLESKLQSARRQLNKVIDDAEPVIHAPSVFERGRPRFVPGALPSLPSERLLSGYIGSNDDIIGQAVTSYHPLFEHSMSSHDLISELKPSCSRSRAPSEDQVLPSIENDGSAAGGIIRVDEKVQSVAEETVGQLSKLVTVEASRFSDVDDENDDKEEEKIQKSKSAANKKQKILAPCEANEKIKAEEIEEDMMFGNVKVNLVQHEDKGDEVTSKMLKSISNIAPSRAAPQPSKPTSSRKRKSFVGYADDGGEYDPNSELSSESESEVASDSQPGIKFKTKVPTTNRRVAQHTSTLTSLKHNASRTRPRKLQRTSPTTSSPVGLQPQYQAPAKKTNLTTKQPALTSLPPSSMPSTNQPIKRLSRSKIPNLAHPSSQESGFVTLDYTKPRAPPVVYEDSNASDDGVPPVPMLPKSVRMPSGEVVSTESLKVTKKKESGNVVSKASSNRTKVSKPIPVVNQTERKEGKENTMGLTQGVDGEYEWDEDIF